MEDIDKVSVIWTASIRRYLVKIMVDGAVTVNCLLEVSFQEVIYRAFQHERVINGHGANFKRLLDEIPTWLSAPGDRAIHHVI